MTENTNEVKYFDLITPRVLGYLNRSRIVNPNQGKPYVCVTLAALRGNADSSNYTYYDCIVVGSDAIDFIKAHDEAINNRDIKVLVKCNVGDSYPDSYVVKNGKNQGQRNHIIKAHLLKISWAKVGDKEFSFSSDDAESTAIDANSSVPVTSQQPQEANVDETGAIEQQQASMEPVDQSQNNDAATEFAFADVVKLSRQDPDYEAKMQALFEQGYGWDRDDKVWRIAA